MTLEERILALELSMTGARKAFADINNKVISQSKKLDQIIEVQSSLRTLFVDLRGEEAVSLHESMNPKTNENDKDNGYNHRDTI